MSPAKKTDVLILGCGFAGSTVAAKLAEKTRKHALIRVIDRKQVFQVPASFQWIMMGWRKPSEVQRSLRPLARKGIEVVNDSIEKVNLQKRIVKTSQNQFSYDHLIIATGAEYAPSLIPGFEEHANHTYDIDHATKFRDAVKNFKGGALTVVVSRTPFKCPPAPYEVALLLERHFRTKRVNATITMFTPEPQPLPAAGPVIGRQMVKLLDNRGIVFKPKTTLKRVEKDRVIFDGIDSPWDLLYAVPP
ncbi:MAG TPA: FAD/NAD(P)-binding oxidoreductase, partial [Candidatus Binatus sp.]|nr:FAD/NAD(P)-binding oxidoreductase [Candidatus Binatus sp.]